MDKDELKKVVNKIFAKAGLPKINKFGADFADGILFERLFNIVYDEKINCNLTPSAVFEVRLNNWSRINRKFYKSNHHSEVICFNYLQQRFYLVEPTMRTLAKGNSADCIFKLLKVLLSTQQGDFESVVQSDTSPVRDIADELSVNKPLFGQ